MPTKLAVVNGRWRLERPLGEGAEAQVYLAIDLSTGEAVALKAPACGDAAAEARLRWEFSALAGLDHPSLVPVRDLGRAEAGGPLDEGQLFFTAEHVAGRSPVEVFRALPSEERARRLLDLLAQLASALDALHARGLVHHDVKPSNLLVEASGRVRLLDFGLAAARAATGVRGTPAYLAPEALLGGGDERVDLWALGATAFELWCGRPPSQGATLAEVARAALAAATAPLVDDAGAAPPPSLERIVRRLLAPAPEGRYSSARVLLDDARRSGASGDRLLARPALRVPSRPALVGREEALQALERAVAPVLAGRPGPIGVVAVVGARGAGRSRIVEEALRRAQLRAAAEGAVAAIHGPDVSSALRTLGVAVADGPTATSSAGAEEAERRRAAAVAAACAALADRPSVLRLDEADDPIARMLLSAAAAGAASPSLIVVEALPEAPALALLGDAAALVSIGALAEADTVALVRSMRDDLGRDFARAVHRASGGLPALAVELVRAAASRRPSPTAADVAPLAGVALEGLIGERVAALDAEALAAVEALAVLGGRATVATVASVAGLGPSEVSAALAAARAAAVVALAPSGALALPTEAHRAAILGALPAARRRALHRRALAVIPAHDVEARAAHLAAVGPRGEAAGALLAAADLSRARLDLPTAIERYRAAIDRGAGAPARLRLADVEVAVGDYRAALATLRGVKGDGATLLAAKALQRMGDDVAAERRLRGALRDGRRRSEEAEASLRGLLGRVLIARGRSAEAIDACAAIRALPEGTAATPLLEARGLAALYLGRGDDAAAAFADAEARARAAGDPVLLGRALSLAGMAAQHRGELSRAAAAYEAGLVAAKEGGDLHGAAVLAQNLGAACRSLADYGRALAATEGAARDLGRLGKRVERAGALFNLGLLLASVGDLDGAERARAEAAELARADGAVRLRAGVRSLEGDLARRRGDAAAALEAYGDAEAQARRGGDAWFAAYARLSRAELLVEQHRLTEADPLLAGDGEGDADLADALAVARLRRGLAGAEPIDEALIGPVDDAAARARSGERRATAFHAEVTLARAHSRAGDLVRARSAVARAHTLWEEIRMRTPEVYRDRLEGDPDARRLRALVEASRPASGSAIAATDDTRLRRLVAINKRLAGELRLGPLLELIIDAVIELTHAERGFVLLRRLGATDDDPTALEVKVARNIDHRSIEAGPSGTPEEGGATRPFSLSRSIAERAAREAAPVVTLDAAGDQRFEAARSVSDLKLRSVLAAPLIARGQVVGCIYVDHRLRAGAFGDDDVALVLEFADQAAIAVENARLLAENQRRGREVAALAARLEKEVASQRLELHELHVELKQSREALKVRYDYRNLVGRTPRMIELFQLLDRVTDTALPVVVYGESGTGKELVARAIHHNGPRAARPFVSENCAAIPETLLEAALFGHVRGAFTGAEGEKRGLFEIADGGTLFLDEVGEMPPAMQSKLLRVLQEGEFRRVGGERGRKVDVPIITASNRDLGRMVEEGRFRQDLFYRLNVVRVALPPLRERPDDIPLLVEHFLGKHVAQAGQRPKRITRAALGKLMGYRWPGNVRELENEVQRAAALGGESITVEDLSPHVAAGEPEAAFSPDDISLKTRVERLERTLLREAMARAGGNQSQAARLLGLSRFGLQKKLRRYAVER